MPHDEFNIDLSLAILGTLGEIIFTVLTTCFAKTRWMLRYSSEVAMSF